MFCLKCGKEIENGATMCPYCNSATENAVDASSFASNTTQPSTSGLGVAAIVTGALGIVMGILIALLGYVFGGAGLAMSIIERSKNGFSKQAVAGTVVSIVALVVSLLNSILGIMMYGGF